MEKEHGIAMHRTTVYNDISLLEKAGVYIHCYRARANQYYLEGRKFELPELKLLIDAVKSSRFMMEVQSQKLVDKLVTLTSDTNAGQLKRAEQGHFQTTVMACTSPTFYGWVFQWGGKIRITGPEAAVSGYKDMLESAQRAWS